ncbi:hypothetical protein tloyanaT_07710 [Thalassotalea loyana]|uniref:DUF3718 domain-containing protein n=1 Tax=Thalassotalea loyana TaxID=280483 RepID=A0ABQ6HAI7_9GAMM|nr:hypothetical protein [Thalassotalea loyana]GLX84519.1 hypothetical protein tloyanaT_07710 [Thalassotalea loyana]
MKLKVIIFFLVSFFCNFSYAATDIGLGTLIAVKVYDLGTDKSIRVYFGNDVTFENQSCLRVAKVTYNAHDKEFVDRFLSVAMAAYMSGKKVRITSNTNDCEASLIALQETRF